MKERIVRHHMVNRCKGGSNDDYNRLRMKESREKLLHRHFGNMSWDDIRNTLQKIFGSRDPHRIMYLMERISRLKSRQKAA